MGWRSLRSEGGGGEDGDSAPSRGVVGWDVLRIRRAVALVQRPGADAAEQHVEPRRELAGVPLEARPLEVLHRVELAGIGVPLDELLADRIAVDRQPSERLPVGPEAETEVVAGRFEVGAAIRRARIRPLGRRFVAAPGGHVAAEQAEEDVVALRPDAGMPLKAGALEVLNGQAVLDELLGHRVAEGRQATEVLPVGAEPGAEVVLRLGEEDAASLRLSRLSRRELTGRR